MADTPTSSSLCAGGSNGEQLSYDNEGRLTAWQNAPSNPTATEQMAYDGKGHRVALLEELTGVTLTKYYRGGATGSDLPLAERVGSPGPLSYLPTDGLGSVDAALDGSGAVTYQALYTVWGRLRYTNGASPTDKGYTGQTSDATSGLDDDTARSYDPMSRQFTSADTVSDGPNPYAYVHENPCTHTDPSGHCTNEPSKLKKVYLWVQIALAWGRTNFTPTPIYPTGPPESGTVGQAAPGQGPGRILPEDGLPQPHELRP